jgi:hypothetical protein
VGGTPTQDGLGVARRRRRRLYRSLEDLVLVMVLV